MQREDGLLEFVGVVKMQQGRRVFICDKRSVPKRKVRVR
jgi:hypothetical protein